MEESQPPQETRDVLVCAASHENTHSLLILMHVQPSAATPELQRLICVCFSAACPSGQRAEGDQCRP